MNTTTNLFSNSLLLNVTVVRNPGYSQNIPAINIPETAERFVDDNLRRIVNRRMRFSNVEQFVIDAMTALENRIHSRPRGLLTLGLREDLLDIVRTATNRRQTWSTIARPALVEVTTQLIQSMIDDSVSVL